MNSVSQLFGIKYPIIQGGMIWCTGANLVSAVSNAGGLGLLGAGSMYVFSGDIANEADGFFKHGLFLPVFQEMALNNNMNHWSTSVFSNTFEISAPKTYKFSS